MSLTISTTLYEFDELSRSAKQMARDWYRTWGLHEYWYDTIYQNARSMAEVLGIEIKEIIHHGFSWQGDGASCSGRYAYRADACEAIRQVAPNDETLHSIADTLEKIQTPYDGELVASLELHPREFHAYAALVEVDVADEDRLGRVFAPYSRSGYTISQDDGKASLELREALRRFMNWIYEELREEYFAITEDEAIDATMSGNEDVLFDADGNFAGYRRQLQQQA